VRDVNAQIRLVAFVCLVALAVGPAHPDEPQARFQIKTRKADDRVITEVQGDRVVLTIMSPSGIGGATITRQSERWPGMIVLRLRLSGLERLQVGNGKVTLSVSVASSADHRTILGLSDGDQKEVPVDRSSPYWMEIRVLDAQGQPDKGTAPKGRVYEVELPRAFLAPNPPTISLDWIDFFR
jgi:hypothetical protein